MAATLIASICFGVAVYLIFLAARQRITVYVAATFQRDSSQQTSLESPSITSTPPSVSGKTPGWLRVLHADLLFEVCGAKSYIDNILRQSRLSALAFERDLLSALRSYAEFVQLFPASESHHHAHVGGLLAHTIEVVNIAMTLRNGYLLPRGGGAETIDQQRDYWTYAIFYAALFHDIGKPMTDLRIEMHQPSRADASRWMPVTGSLIVNAATEYRVDFAPKIERDYSAHQRFPFSLMQRLAPVHVLTFIARQPAIMNELTQFLSGESKSSVIGEILKRADQESTQWNLAQGPRTRFTTARTIPLIERLMQAMREMLVNGGALPLNRDGAIGWVFDGAVWFVAKRLADTVREHIVKAASDQEIDGIPGANKNDRLFDTWQEYGVITPNPDTGQAIWYVAVEGEGYTHELTVLRFSLQKVFEREQLYPPAFQGRIRILPRREKKVEGGGAEAPSKSHSSFETPPPTKTSDNVSDEEYTGIPAAEAKELPASPLGPVETLRYVDPDDNLIDTDESASQEANRLAQLKRIKNASAKKTPVTPFVPAPPALGHLVSAQKEEREPSEAAIRFMNWLQQGIADGSIKYNEVSAPIHFVDAGMLLISPRIFREFASQFGESGDGTPSEKTPDKVGTGIQRHVINAGWNLVGQKKSNIFHFAVVKRGGVQVSKLAAVVIQKPERWIAPVPPSNPNIVPFETEKLVAS